MDWVDEVLSQKEQFLEPTGPGDAFCWRVVDDNEGNRCLQIAPARLEVIGGQNDGARVFTMFTVLVAPLLSLFDGETDVLWVTEEDMLLVAGDLHGEPAWVEIFSYPFDGELDGEFDGEFDDKFDDEEEGPTAGEDTLGWQGELDE